MTPAEPILAIEGLSIAFRTAAGLRPVLRDIDLTLERGEVLGLVGESGSGKSTVLFAVMNHLAPNAVIESGRVRYGSQDLLTANRARLDEIRGRRLAMVYQDPGMALNPAMRVGDQVAEVRQRHFGASKAAARRAALETFDLVGLEDPLRIGRAYRHQLSGGQCQRVMIAMALAGEPDVLLMDEPTTALDVVVQARVLDLIRHLKGRIGAAILFVSHDLGAVAGIADRIGVLYAGELMELGPAGAVLRDARNPYTRGLLAAIPRVEGRVRPTGIPGNSTKDPTRFRRCVFVGRCGVAEALCERVRPELAVIDETGRSSRCHFARDQARLARWPTPLERAPTSPVAEPERGTPLLAAEDLVVEYRRPGVLGTLGGEILRAVDGVSFRLGRRRVLAVVGESGSGKSTLARAILRLESKKRGHAWFEGEEIFALGARKLLQFRRGVQIVFQNPTSSLNPRKRVLHLVARPLRLTGKVRSRVEEQSQAILAAVGIGQELLARYPHELSGGEKQRVALARAFATQPALVILDEPTTALDVSVQATVLQLLEQLKASTGCSYLLITHDLAVVRQLADDIIVMRAGRICEAAPAEKLFKFPQHPYTRALLQAVPCIEPFTAGAHDRR